MKRRLTEREQRAETRAIWLFIVILLIILVMAGYGYFTGAWTPLE